MSARSQTNLINNIYFSHIKKNFCFSPTVRLQSRIQFLYAIFLLSAGLQNSFAHKHAHNLTALSIFYFILFLSCSLHLCVCVESFVQPHNNHFGTANSFPFALFFAHISVCMCECGMHPLISDDLSPFLRGQTHQKLGLKCNRPDEWIEGFRIELSAWPFHRLKSLGKAHALFSMGHCL